MRDHDDVYIEAESQAFFFLCDEMEARHPGRDVKEVESRAEKILTRSTLGRGLVEEFAQNIYEGDWR